MKKAYLSTLEASDFLSGLGVPFTTKTLETWRSRNRGPAYRRVGGKIVYSVEALERFARGRHIRTLDSMEGV